jgi:hypothetical protein
MGFFKQNSIEFGESFLLEFNSMKPFCIFFSCMHLITSDIWRGCVKKKERLHTGITGLFCPLQKILSAVFCL